LAAAVSWRLLSAYSSYLWNAERDERQELVPGQKGNPMEEDRLREMAKDLGTYADSTAGFSFVQGVALGYAFAASDFHKQLRGWPMSIVSAFIVIVLFSSAIYLFIVLRCHAGQDELIAPPQTSDLVGRWTVRIRRGRVLIVLLGAAISVFAILMNKLT
jgi:hypothetical protein